MPRGWTLGIPPVDLSYFIVTNLSSMVLALHIFYESEEGWDEAEIVSQRGQKLRGYYLLPNLVFLQIIILIYTVLHKITSLQLFLTLKYMNGTGIIVTATHAIFIFSI